MGIANEENKIEEKKITLNEKEITLEELEKFKEEIKGKKGTQLVEISPNCYKTRLLD